VVVFFDDMFNLQNGLWHYKSFGLSQSRSICHTRQAILRFPTAFVHLLQQYACITVLWLCMAMDLVGFTPSLTKKQVTECCSCFMQGTSHLCTALLMLCNPRCQIFSTQYVSLTLADDWLTAYSCTQ
jgi:hypothetical protein